MRVAVVGLGLIGGSIALGLREKHEVTGYDTDPATRAAALGRGLAIVDDLASVLPADAVVVATPLGSIVPTIESLIPLAGDTPIIEVGSLKADVAALAERAPATARIVGLHPMAGRTATGFAAADPALFRGRPFIVVHTARIDDVARRSARRIALDLGGMVTECDAVTHDRAIATVSALPLAAALALSQVIGSSLPMPVDRVAGPGARDATRLAATPTDLALRLLAAPGIAEDLAALRVALLELEGALGDDGALRDLISRWRG